MSRTLRWRIVVPRLLLVVVLLLAVQYGLGGLARWIAAGSLATAAGASVEIGHARVSVTDRQLVLGDLRIRGTANTPQALLEIDCCALDFSMTPLLYKQAVFERGVLAGVRFSAPVSTGRPQGALDSRFAESSIKWSDSDACETAGRWLKSLNQCIQRDIPDQFATLEQIEKLCSGWTAHSATFDQQVRDLKSRAAHLHRSLEFAQQNPLRHLEFLKNLPSEVATLRTELAGANAELDQLAHSLAADRRALVLSRRQDQQQLNSRLRLGSIDANALTAYLLREKMAAQLNEVISVLRWTRQVIPADQAPLGSRGRGEDVVFTGCRPEPSLLIRKLQLQGTARLGGQTVELHGTLSDFNNAPALHSAPIRLRVETTGSLPLQLQATIDRTGSVARDELLVDCRGVVMPERNLGRSDSFLVKLAPSVASLSISALVEGEKLSGDIQLIERQVHITPLLAGQLSDVPMTAIMQATLSELDMVAVRLSLGGTLSDPTCSLWSNLGPAVAEAMDRALQRTSDEHACELLARSCQQLDDLLADLEWQFQTRRDELASQSAAATGDLQRIAAQQSPAPRLSHEQLGRRLPAGSLFR